MKVSLLTSFMEMFVAFGVYGCGQYKMIDVDGALMMITVCFGVVYSSAPPAGQSQIL